MRNSNQPIKIGDYAYNLFGKSGLEKPKEIPINNSLLPTQAIYPAVTGEAFAKTMDAYRLFVDDYNKKLSDINFMIEKHNAKMSILTKNNKLTEVQKAFSAVFYKKNWSKKPTEYNLLADQFISDYGLCVVKKKIQKVKYSTEKVFENMLHAYNSQLMKRNAAYMSLGVKTPTCLPMFEINSYHVTALKRNGVASIDVCGKTIRNHRERLEECGVLTDYVFSGTKRGVKNFINPKILFFFDLETKVLRNAENQPFNLDLKKDFPNNKVITRTNINKYKIKANVHSHERSSLSLTDFNLNFYKNTSSKEGNFTEGAAAENVKISENKPEKQETNSEKLLKTIIHPQQLANELTQGKYNAYHPIDLRLLENVSYHGTLTNDEFKEIVVQDLIKTSAKIWRSKNVFVGSWKKAITQFMTEKFSSYNGAAMNQWNLMKYVEEYRWRLSKAHRFFTTHTNFNPLFPNQYFDFTRNTAKEGGFEYTKQFWKKHLKDVENAPVKKAKREQQALKRKETNTEKIKLQQKIQQFYKCKITMAQLLEFVHKIKNDELKLSFSEMLNKNSVKYNC